MNNILRITTVLAASSALCGCAVMDSIHWKFPGPGDSQVFTTDAKQRHLIMTNDASAKPGEKVRVCAEAAPDAFSAFSSSLSGSLGIGSASRKADAASAFAETAATIERTQTVNLLRESMYRTCERWLSGALSKQEFLMLAARDHRSMIAVLAIEQLTGVVKPPSTVISGPATRTLLAQTELLVELLNSYRAERVAAEKAEIQAAGELAAADVEITNADGTKAKVCSLATAPGNEAAHAKCKPAADKAQTTKAVADAARARENAVLKDIGKLSGGISAGTDAGSFSAGGYTAAYPRISDLALIAMSKSVEKIALTAGINEALIFCIGYLNAATSEQTTRDTCNRVVYDQARSDEQVKSKSFEYTLSGSDVPLITTRISDYDQFRTNVAKLISITPDGDWQSIWAGFVDQTPTPKKICTTKSICLTYFVGGYPLTYEFNKEKQKFWDALDAWTKTLAAKGINP